MMAKKKRKKTRKNQKTEQRPKKKVSKLKLLLGFLIFVLILGNAVFFYLGYNNAKKYQIFGKDLENQIAKIPALKELPKENYQSQIPEWENFKNSIKNITFSQMTVPEKLGARELISKIEKHFDQFEEYFQDLKTLAYLEEHQKDFDLASINKEDEKEAAYAALFLRMDALKRSQGLKLPKKFSQESKDYENAFNKYYQDVKDSQEKVKNNETVKLDSSQVHQTLDGLKSALVKSINHYSQESLAFQNESKKFEKISFILK